MSLSYPIFIQLYIIFCLYPILTIKRIWPSNGSLTLTLCEYSARNYIQCMYQYETFVFFPHLSILMCVSIWNFFVFSTFEYTLIFNIGFYCFFLVDTNILDLPTITNYQYFFLKSLLQLYVVNKKKYSKEYSLSSYQLSLLVKSQLLSFHFLRGGAVLFNFEKAPLHQTGQWIS